MEIIIKPKSKFHLLDIKELIYFRELIYIFAWRDIKVKYKQTFLGVLWVIFQPITAMVLFTLVFSNLKGVTSSNLPYPLFVLIGLIMWNYFSGIINSASNSFLENERIIQKVYIPKETLVISSLITNFIDFAISLIILIPLMIYFDITPSVSFYFVLFLSTIIVSLTALGIGFLLSSLNVKYRDVRYILPFFIQLFFFITPIIYSTNSIRSEYKYLLLINPLTNAIENLRYSIANTYRYNFSILEALFISIIICLIGILYFRTVERYFADII